MTPEAAQSSFEIRSHLFLRWVQKLFLLTGALAVIYVALVLLHGTIFQNSANSILDKEIDAEEQPGPALSAAAAKEGDVLGRIQIPRLGMEVAILEGTTSQTLLLGVGHIKGTALPGEPGNIGIAGHRDTYFRDLRDIRNGDEIQIQTRTGRVSYEVDSLQIVAPGDTGMLAATTRSTITLVTCYPFHYIGAAPERFIVHGHKS
jgi:sortase A